MCLYVLYVSVQESASGVDLDITTQDIAIAIEQLDVDMTISSAYSPFYMIVSHWCCLLRQHCVNVPKDEHQACLA